VRNEEVFIQSQGEEKQPTCNKRKEANWIGHIVHRNCLLKHVIEGKAGIQGRGCKQLLEYLKEMRGYRKLKE
jgi:hypothetical protein